MKFSLLTPRLALTSLVAMLLAMVGATLAQGTQTQGTQTQGTRVALVQPVTYPVMVEGRPSGSVTLKEGTQVEVLGVNPQGVVISLNNTSTTIPASALDSNAVAGAVAARNMVVLAKKWEKIPAGTSIQCDHIIDDSAILLRHTGNTWEYLETKFCTPDSLARFKDAYALGITGKSYPPGTFINSATTRAEVNSAINWGKIPHDIETMVTLFSYHPSSFTQEFKTLNVPIVKQENENDASAVVAVANALNYLFTKKEGHPVEVSRAFLTWAHDQNALSDAEIATSTHWDPSPWKNNYLDPFQILDEHPSHSNTIITTVNEGNWKMVVDRVQEHYDQVQAIFDAHPELWDEIQFVPNPELNKVHPEMRPFNTGHYISKKTGKVVETPMDVQNILDETAHRKASINAWATRLGPVMTNHAASLVDTLAGLQRFGVCEEALMPRSILDTTNPPAPSPEAMTNAATRKNLVIRCFNSLQDSNAVERDQSTEEWDRAASAASKLQGAGQDAAIKTINADWNNRRLHYYTRLTAFIQRELAAGHPVVITTYIPSPISFVRPIKEKNGYSIIDSAGMKEPASFVITGATTSGFELLTPFGKEFAEGGWELVGENIIPGDRHEIYSLGFE